jgi:hypothetical protein
MVIEAKRTPWRGAGDAVVEAAELLLDGERHQFVGLHGGHGAAGQVKLPPLAARPANVDRRKGRGRGGARRLAMERWEEETQARLPFM